MSEQPGRSLATDSELLLALEDSMGGGREPFLALSRGLASALSASHAFVAVPAGEGRARTLAFWGLGARLPERELSLEGTPCAEVLLGATRHIPRGLLAQYPRAELPAMLGAESYLGAPLLDAQGAVIGHIAVLDRQPLEEHRRLLSILRLFAARAAAELSRTLAEERLRQSEQRFRDLFEEAPIAYVYEDTETRFVSANRAFVQLLGLKPEEVRGTVGRTLLAPSSETRAKVDEAFADIQHGKERGRIELELRRKDDGRPVFVQFWSRPEPDGKHTRTMLIDITDRVLAEQERNRLRHQNSYLREELKHEHNFDEIVGTSRPLERVLDQVRQVAPTGSTVLILGETGAGKELIARAIHNRSARRDRPLIKLNCAALPTGLIESELFGHEKGAFTGALERRIGRFALADGGTIFLDEIGDIPPEVQLRLLRVLQEYEFEPVGSTRTVKVDVRVIAATNKDLEQAVERGAFRADLYYRLNVFPVQVPPLRERREDIPVLVHYFAAKYAAKMGKHIDQVPADTMQRLTSYPWPGNVRELQNVVERAVILSPAPVLEVDPSVLRLPPHAAELGRAPPLAEAARDAESIRRSLEEARWVIEGERGAAKALGLHPNTLRSRMKKLGIRRGQTDAD